MNIKHIINEEIKSLNEYITKNDIYLKDYLSMSEEEKKQFLPDEYNYFFDDFLDETGRKFSMPKEMKPTLYADDPEEEQDMFDNNLELMTHLEHNDKDLYDAFADYLYNKIVNFELSIPETEYPAWSYFEDSPTIIKNQWLIHFTEDANSIASEGFKFGVDDMTKLGLTTELGEFYKKYGGYNFAYTLSDFVKYGSRDYTEGGGYKYGKEAIVFNASGIRVWHFGDEEYQTIFYGNTATNIIPITSGENKKWAIYNKTGKILFKNDNLEKVVNWLITNYSQYRKNLK